MAKVNINKAGREELMEVGGLKAPMADAVLKAREEHGRFASVDALKEALKDAKGLTAASFDHLHDTVEFGAAAAREAAEKTADTAATAARAGADATRRTAEKTAEVTSIAARTGAEQVTRLATNVAETEKAMVERSAGVATDIGQIVVGLMSDQMQANVETLKALARTRDWREAMSIQNGYVRGNIERATQGTSRYVEAMTRLMTGMVDVGRKQAKKAA